MSTFSETVRQYEKACQAADVPAETVMAYLVELSRQERYSLYLHFEETMPAELEAKFRAGMERIVAGEPMAHVLGYSWFYGYRFLVNGDVLIPRPETEELCAHILSRVDRLFPTGELLCCDVGTGSGAIAVTLCLEEPRLRMMATDISPEAVAKARENADLNGARVEFAVGDMLGPLRERNSRLDILISNPPYIPSGEQMAASVADYEPHVALFGGQDGLRFYREIFAGCRQVLRPRAMMAFEMGWDQRERMGALVREMLPEAKYEILKDMSGKDRMLFVYFGMDDALADGSAKADDRL